MKVYGRIPWRLDLPDARRPDAGVASALARLALSALLAISLFEALGTVRGAYHLANIHDPRLILGLAIALIPCFGVGVWAGTAIVLQLDGFWRRSQSIGTPANRRRSSARATSLTRPLTRKKSEPRTWIWIGTAFAAALGLTVAVLATIGTGQDGINTALRATGRLSLLLFWPAYAGGAVAALCGPRFDMMRRHMREFGLAYASAQLVHFSLVAWLIRASHGPISERVMPFFAVGAVWTYLLAASSSPRLHAILGPTLLRIFRTIGVEYIALVFFADFVLFPAPGGGVGHQIAYLPFSILIMVGALLRAGPILRRLGTAVRSWSGLPRSPLRR
jgi:hypothetical protein